MQNNEGDVQAVGGVSGVWVRERDVEMLGTFSEHLFRLYAGTTLP